MESAKFVDAQMKSTFRTMKLTGKFAKNVKFMEGFVECDFGKKMRLKEAFFKEGYLMGRGILQKQDPATKSVICEEEESWNQGLSGSSKYCVIRLDSNYFGIILSISEGPLQFEQDPRLSSDSPYKVSKGVKVYFSSELMLSFRGDALFKSED